MDVTDASDMLRPVLSFLIAVEVLTGVIGGVWAVLQPTGHNASKEDATLEGHPRLKVTGVMEDGTFVDVSKLSEAKPRACFVSDMFFSFVASKLKLPVLGQQLRVAGLRIGDEVAVIGVASATEGLEQKFGFSSFG